MLRVFVLLVLSWITIMADITTKTAADALAADDIPRLPPPDPNASKDIPTIKLGETIRFEEWGPIILNTDGTTRRIDNWDQLTEKEKEVTWRRISKRNEERRKLLLEQQQAENTNSSEDKEL
ncbi:hypothetical protein IV203_005670 [Nitzschia inconspicua]|uniref:Uncharacterized protein n=1 Tax=Nitzschia inconspicua TaxID=303405 RepID=A0A9K3PH47_9STRA|nr:hypothetical protein IV203_005670 [Nitzschia inconspicua]